MSSFSGDTALAMSQETVQLAKDGIAAINETYATGDLLPWRRHVEKAFDPEVVVEAGGEAFTEGEWRGHEGAVKFVANQMEVLEACGCGRRST